MRIFYHSDFLCDEITIGSQSVYYCEPIVIFSSNVDMMDISEKIISPSLFELKSHHFFQISDWILTRGATYVTLDTLHFISSKISPWFSPSVSSGIHILHSVEISGFFCHPDFTWKQFWLFWCPKTANFDIFEQLWILNF